MGTARIQVGNVTLQGVVNILMDVYFLCVFVCAYALFNSNRFILGVLLGSPYFSRSPKSTFAWFKKLLSLLLHIAVYNENRS